MVGVKTVPPSRFARASDQRSSIIVQRDQLVAVTSASAFRGIASARGIPGIGFWEVDPQLSPSVYLNDASRLLVTTALIATDPAGALPCHYRLPRSGLLGKAASNGIDSCFDPAQEPDQSIVGSTAYSWGAA